MTYNPPTCWLSCLPNQSTVCERGIKSSFIHEDWHKPPVHCKKKTRMKLEQQAWLWTRPPMETSILWPTQGLLAKDHEPRSQGHLPCQRYSCSQNQSREARDPWYVPTLLVFWFCLLKFIFWNIQPCSNNPWGRPLLMKSVVGADLCGEMDQHPWLP